MKPLKGSEVVRQSGWVCREEKTGRGSWGSPRQLAGGADGGNAQSGDGQVSPRAVFFLAA